MIEYLKSFIIGSSILVTFVFLTTVIRYQEKGIISYKYRNYSILAPIYFGTMTVIAKYISLHTQLSLRISIFMISVVSILCVISFITITKSYPFHNRLDWYRQYVKVALSHLVTFNIIIYKFETCLGAKG